jgi:CRISPR/Cas system-associated exonuclease Cas4 (RecB family)
LKNYLQDTRPDLDNVIASDKPEELGLIPAWSYSTLKTYEGCPYRLYINKVKKIQEDYGEAAARGTLIHEEAEAYVKAELDELPDSLKKFSSQFSLLRDQYAESNVELEGEWGFTIDWEPCGWMDRDVWARVKLDAILHESETSARVIDHKTGRQFGNEIAHSQQGLVYAIATFFRYPELESLNTEFWYLDHGGTLEKVYTRAEAMMFMPKLQERALDLTTATRFRPNPSQYNCKWCSYGKGEHPVCEWSFK